MITCRYLYLYNDVQLMYLLNLYVIVRLTAPCLGDSIQRARNFGNVCDSTIMLMMMMMMIRKEKKSCLEKKRLSLLGVGRMIICGMMYIVLYSE